LYRITRNSLYSHPLCEGHKDISKRNGFFLEARCDRHALKQAYRKYPEDLEGFTVELWEEEKVKASAIAFWVEYVRARLDRIGKKE
ncbi:MAG: hypothetical protein F6K28_57900, partial [Microcoleus sp. SIO2G3]|nr:hypothetical protein [Microcoleus sp. SIO2G3]